MGAQVAVQILNAWLEAMGRPFKGCLSVRQGVRGVSQDVPRTGPAGFAG